jgi:hypothetical protein
MPDRKHTPDVLGEILGEVAAVEAPAVRPSRHATQPRPAAREPASRLSAGPRVRVAQHACWEYRIVSFQNYRGWRPRFISGAEIEDWMAAPVIHDYLNSLGEEGWEVAGAASGHTLYGSSDVHQVYLKRLKPDGN